MKKKAHIYTNYHNIVVQQTYLDIIRKSLMEEGYDCDYVKKIEGMPKDDLYVFSLGNDAVKWYIKGYRKYIIWQQGATADESFMRNHSKMRYHVLNMIDCFAMKKAQMIFFCSEYMKKHYEHLAKEDFSDKSYIMPCFNEKLSMDAIQRKDYSKKIFAYVGSLAIWQCFDETVKIFKEIQKIYPDAEFKVLTFSVDETISKIKAAGIKNYQVKCVPKEEVQKELEEVTYGFLIRENSIVNRVATPTKISSYMSAGVIPIFSDVLDDFYRISKEMKYVIPMNNNVEADKIINFLNIEIDKKELMAEYEYLFDTYYSEKQHSKQISKLIRKILKY